MKTKNLFCAAVFAACGSAKTQTALTVDRTSVLADGSDAAVITVLLHDTNDKVLTGVSVSVSATGSGNTLTPASAKTDANGTAVFTLSSTVAEAKTISTPGATSVSVQFVAPSQAATAPSASNSTLTVSPNALRADGKSAATIALVVKDANGNAVANTPFTLAISGSENSLASPASATTDANGNYSATFTSTQAETKSVTVSVNGALLQASVEFQHAWIQANGNLYGDPTAVAIDAGTPETIYVGGWGEAFRSQDGGKTWQTLACGFDVASAPANADIQAFAFDTTVTPHTVYALLYSEALDGGIVYRLRAGETCWENFSELVGVNTLLADGDTIYAAGDYPGGDAFVAELRPGDSDFVPQLQYATDLSAFTLDTSTSPPTGYFAGSGDVYDASTLTMLYSSGLPSGAIYYLAVEAPGILLAYINDDIYRYSGTTWVQVSAGLDSGASILAVTQDKGDLVAAVSDTDNSLHTAVLANGAATWTESAHSVASLGVSAVARDASSVFVATQFTGVSAFAADDQSAPVMLGTGLLGDNIYFLAVGSDHTLYAAESTEELSAFSKDGGQTWTSIDASALTPSGFTALVAGDTIYVATYMYGVAALSNGAWVPASTGLSSPQAQTIKDLEWLSVGGAAPALYAATLDGPFVYNGTRWTEVTSGNDLPLTGGHPYTFALNVDGNGDLVVSSSGGLYSLTGGNWTQISGANCPTAQSSRLLLDAGTGTLLAQTEDNPMILVSSAGVCSVAMNGVAIDAATVIGKGQVAVSPDFGGGVQLLSLTDGSVVGAGDGLPSALGAGTQALYYDAGATPPVLYAGSLAGVFATTTLGQ